MLVGVARYEGGGGDDRDMGEVVPVGILSFSFSR